LDTFCFTISDDDNRSFFIFFLLYSIDQGASINVGDKMKQYTIENDYISLTILDKGASILSLKVLTDN